MITGSSPVPDSELSEPSGGARLIAFADAVIAIAITLLALDLPVPTGHTADELWTSVRQDAGHYLSFLISFGVIAALWHEHHRVFQYLERSDGRLRVLTVWWLMTIVLVPFASRLLTANPDSDQVVHGIMFSFYAVNQVLAGSLFLLTVRHGASAGLFSDRMPHRLRAVTDRDALGLAAGFAISIPVLFVTEWGWLLWVVIPPVVGRWARRRSAKIPMPED
jgi:uncharacterized membrane protein